MNWMDAIVKGAKSVLSVIPSGDLLVGVANQFLPDEQKLTTANKAEDLLKVYQMLDANQQAKFDKQAEIELAQITASVDKLQAMVSAETATGNTRPYIAKLFAQATVAIGALVVLSLAFAILTNQSMLVKEIKELWPLVLALVAPFLAVIRSYFGMRTAEKKSRYQAATGQGLATGIATKLINKLTGS